MSASPSAGVVATENLHIFSSVATEPNHVADSPNSVLINSMLEVKEGAYVGGATNYHKVDSSGNVTFSGAAGFYPRVLEQDGEPAAGTGATQIDSGETIIWIDTNDSNRSYQMYNYGGAVTKIELV